jgi:hypothetical protein
VSKRGGSVSWRVGCAILDHITRLPLNLTVLGLCLVQDGGNEDFVPLNIDPSQRDLVADFFKSATTLSELIVSPFSLDKYLPDISRLPALSRLELRDIDWSGVSSISLPDGSFSALRELKLDRFNIPEVGHLWSMTPLVKNIETLEVLLRPTTPRSPLEPIPDGFPLSLFTMLLAGSPHITILRLEFDPTSENRFMPGINDDSFRTLSQLPLRVLSLDSIFIPTNRLTDVVELIAALFPHLEVFRCPCQYVDYKHLYLFSKVPKLEYLAVELDRMYMTEDLGRLPRVSPPGNTTLRMLESSFLGGIDESDFGGAT